MSEYLKKATVNLIPLRVQVSLIYSAGQLIILKRHNKGPYIPNNALNLQDRSTTNKLHLSPETINP